MFASLCFLSYNRSEFLEDAFKSALVDPGFPCEVIVHDDGSDPETQYAVGRITRDDASLTIFNRVGNNEGVGRAVERTFSLASGDYLVKIDQDLIFNPGWLKKGIDVIEADSSVGMVGFFKYPVDPVNWERMQLADGDFSGDGAPRYHYVEDFVSSVFLITRDVYETLGSFPQYSDAFAEDVEYKNRIKNELCLNLALLDNDMVVNRGFGPGPSTIVSQEHEGAEVKVTKIKHGPWVRQ